jgi:hypothetical protein
MRATNVFLPPGIEVFGAIRGAVLELVREVGDESLAFGGVFIRLEREERVRRSA